MSTLDPAGEFLRIAERYRQMSDSELRLLMPQLSDLTPLAQQALASEIRNRGLKPEDTPEPHKPEPGDYYLPTPAANAIANRDVNEDDSGDEDAYQDDRELVDFVTVYSLRDAVQVQSLLDRAGIPFVLGPEKATRAEAATSNFSNGVSVQVMRIGTPWAAQAMQYYEPADEPPAEPEDSLEPVDLSCPNCHSNDITLQNVISNPSPADNNATQQFQWICDACGNRWEDDGTVREN